MHATFFSFSAGVATAILLPSKHFLRLCYEQTEGSVAHACLWEPGNGLLNPEQSAYFLRGLDCPTWVNTH